jgi:tagatose-1,6-bisphosphate aldolase non-catalytic subunit AgaZ/GatZ
MAILDVAAVLKYGADKYGDNNWRKIPTQDHLNHALAHIFAYLQGDKGDHHLGHAACRTLMALEISHGGSTHPG